MTPAAEHDSGVAMRTPAAARIAGFTLFEVMAAVLVLGMLYSVLASSAIQGVRSQGESRRRLEASLLVDQVLLELEAGLATGLLPEIGREESEEGQYRVVVEVAPFDVTPFLGEDFDEQLGENSGSTLLEPTESPEESLLRLISVVVAWDEAEGEHEVRRTTLGFDQATVAGLFPDPGGDEPGGVPSDLEDVEDVQAEIEALLQRTGQSTGDDGP